MLGLIRFPAHCQPVPIAVEVDQRRQAMVQFVDRVMQPAFGGDVAVQGERVVDARRRTFICEGVQDRGLASGSPRTLASADANSREHRRRMVETDHYTGCT
jgi:hypothetical protein